MTDTLRQERMRWRDERRIADKNLQSALDHIESLRELVERQQTEITRLKRLLSQELKRSLLG